MSASGFFMKMACAVLLGGAFTCIAATGHHSHASAAANVTIGPSGLPLPRFVSLKFDRVNSRVGPGFSYPVKWLYVRAGLPVELLQEYDTWRKIRDSDGAEGWVNRTLLTGRRTGIITPWYKGKDVRIDLRSEPHDKARPVALLEPGLIGVIKSCNGTWCEMTFKGHEGWIVQNEVWGAYPGELVKD